MFKYSKNIDTEIDIDQLLRDYDETFMPLPDMESEPHLLISKVRKHYMEYMIKILSVNYETNQKLVNKNIYLPSAIWKCAKNLEMKAAQNCMVVQLYRKCVVSMINEVKGDTKKGKLYKKLYESLHVEPSNEKRTQTLAIGDICQCFPSEKKRRRKRPSPAKVTLTVDLTTKVTTQSADHKVIVQDSANDVIQKIPVVTNMRVEPNPVQVVVNEPQIEPSLVADTTQSIEQNPDELMLQLEKLFEGNNEEDLFETTLFNNTETAIEKIEETKANDVPGDNVQKSIIDNHSAQIKSLDERLVTLSGLLTNNDIAPQQQQKVPVPQKKLRKYASKWYCEEYFMRKSLYDLLYQIGDANRNKLVRIKQIYIHLFGEDSDDEEGIVSPDESAELVGSCKARIDSWVVTMLAPYYAKGHIQGKSVYKGVARHLIQLIYKCKPYPSRYEVTSFVMDFLESRGKIRCEADYKEFKIDHY